MLLAPAKSGTPSPLKSPTATDTGVPPATELRGASKLTPPVGVLLISTETLLELALATAKSSRPSRLKSPTATEEGGLPAGKLRASWKLPSPLPKSTETLLA